jgi:hypothetical protein
MSAGKLERRLSLWLSAALWLGLLLAGLRLSTRWPDWTLELGRRPWGEPSAAELALLERLPGPARLTHYVSAPEALPANLRKLPGEIERLLDKLEQASGGRLTWRRFQADRDEEARRLAADRRVAPTRRRQVLRDGWSESEFYSALEIELLGGRSLVLGGLGPEQLPRLPSLVLQHLGELAAPRPPRIGLCAPAAGYSGLEALLRARGEVRRLEPKELDPAALAGLDLLLLLDPPALSEQLVEDLRRARERGQSQLFGLQRRRATLGEVEGELALQFLGTGVDPSLLLASLGLSAPRWPLFDGRCENQQRGERVVDLPFLLRAIAPNQDFRALGSQPNGTLLFPTPMPILAVGSRLEELALEAAPLATSSELSFTVAGLEDAGLALDPAGALLPSAPLRLSALTPAAGRPLPKQALLMRITSPDPWIGEALVMGSPRAFSDEFLGLEGYAHRRLAEILLNSLTRPERLVAARADLPRPAPLAPLSNGAQQAWRLALLAPLLLLLLAIALWRGLRPWAALRGGARGRAPRWALLALLLILTATLSQSLPSRLRADLSADASAGLAPATVELARAAAAGEGLTLEWIASPPGRLPAALRAPERLARQRLRELAERVPGIRLVTRPADAADGELVAELQGLGIEAFPVESGAAGERSQREVFLTLLLSRGAAREQLDFWGAAALEDFEFRLAAACWRLQGHARPRLALATDVPRLSPAEAHSEYLQRKLFAPVGSDVYSLARAALERLDFEVLHVDPIYPALPEGIDALFWLQPRRPTEAMLPVFAAHLYGGGRAFLASQHLVLQAQAHRGRGFDPVFWPEPQFADVHERWFPSLGLSQEVAVWFDAQNFEREQVNRINLDEQQRAYVKQDAALPFLVRASSAYFADDPLLAGVGDQALAYPSPFALDPAALAAAGLTAEVLIETSEASWRYPWSGGFVPEPVLAGPGPEAPATPRAPLFLRLSGQFPLPPAPPGEGAPAPVLPLPAPGELLLLGASEPFKNAALQETRYRGDRLLANAAAHLTLPPELAAVLGRRPTPRGLYFTAPERRLAWRAGVLALPLLALPAGWWLRRRGGPR